MYNPDLDVYLEDDYAYQSRDITIDGLTAHVEWLVVEQGLNREQAEERVAALNRERDHEPSERDYHTYDGIDN